MMHDPEDLEDEQLHFFRKHRVAIIISLLAFAWAIGLVVKFSSGGASASRRVPPNVTMVSILPPPPPPPTPPPIQPPEQVIKEEEQTIQPEEQPEEMPPEPPDEPPLGTGIKGDGSNDNFGLGNKPGTGRLGENEGSRYAWYAGQVQSKVAEALRRNSRTRNAQLSLKVRVWPDAAGRITRAQLADSTGDPAMDDAIRNEILNGLQLQGPPPEGMPTPITLRLTARRP